MGKQDRVEWNRYVKSFKNWDIYYLYEYAYSFMLHGDGDILLVCFENKNERICYTVMEKDISNFAPFKGKIQTGRFFDWETPYGYGGPLSDGSISPVSQELFKEEIMNYCQNKGVVTQFVRFHPLLKNYEILPSLIETRYLKDTVYIDTTDKNLIMQNMDSKNRNMVRKALKCGVTVERKTILDNEEFIDMYTETMKKNDADEYYTFDKDYFNSLKELDNNAFIVYAMYDGKPISGAIMYYNDRFMHYHLSGSHTEYRHYSPSNLMLYEAAVWASERGIKKFHLGGGMQPNDSLFGFKKQFNKNGYVPFVVGRTIFDKTAYNLLLDIRVENEENFNPANGFMIQYRR